jgi:hypothetical protein
MDATGGFMLAACQLIEITIAVSLIVFMLTMKSVHRLIFA